MSWKLTLLLLVILSCISLPQQDTMEVFLIDSFVTPEEPHTFKISFFTSEPAKSVVIIDNTYEYKISEEYTDQHKAEIVVEDMGFTKQTVPFIILVEDSLGTKSSSELYEFEIPFEVNVEGGSDMFTMCLFGGAIFLLPSPVFVYTEEENYFSLTKEIPIIFLRSSGIGYPRGYFSVEYSYLFNAPNKNLFRYGYKHLIEIPGIEYVSPGINGFTDFRGFNGITPELSFGLFRYNVFTFYARYRYNVKPGEHESRFHEISIGLYSGFFALYF